VTGLFLIGSMSLVVRPLAAHAAVTFTVNTFTDSPDATPGDGVCADTEDTPHCSLRAAVMEADALAGADTISVPTHGIYTLTIPPSGGDDSSSGDLNITQDVTITGGGAAETIVDGNATDRVFNIQN